MALAFSPKSNALVLAHGGNGELRVIDFSDPAKPTMRRIAEKVGAAAFMPDGRYVVTGGDDGAVRLLTLDGGAAGPLIHPPGEKITAIAVSARGRFLAAVDRKLQLRVWETAGPRPRLRFAITLDPKSAPSERADVAFAPDESAIAAISNYGSVFVRGIDGRPIEVPLGRVSYESCCGVNIGFTADARFLIARRGYEPGWDAFVWTFRSGRLDGGARFPDAARVRDFTATAGSTLVILEKSNEKSALRTVTLEDDEGMPLGLPSSTEVRTLLDTEAAKGVELFAVSADGQHVATSDLGRDTDGPTSGAAIVYRDSQGAPLGRLALR